MNHNVVPRALMATLCSVLLTCISLSLYAQVTESANNEEDPTPEDPSAGEPGAATRNIFIGNQAGIAIDAMEVLRRQLGRDSTVLNTQRLAAAYTSLDGGMLRPSKLRKVSLTRLEQAARALHEKDGKLPLDMLYLAGLTRVSNVFLYPHSGDVVIAGPASGWFDDGNDNVLALDSLQPVLRLQDLAVALRAFPPHEQADAVIGCSMDPTGEGWDRMLIYLKSVQRPPSTVALAKQLESALGNACVTVDGIPARTRLADVMLCAVFRMQLIAMGIERPPVDIPALMALSPPTSRQLNRVRWCLIPNYDCVQLNEKELAMQLVGERVRLLSQDEFLAGVGNRDVSGERDSTSQRFARAFTLKYEQLAQRSPVFAELRNLVDLSIVAAFLQQFDAYERCHWTPKFLLDQQQFSVHIGQAPEQIATAAAPNQGGQVTPNGGDISIRPGRALRRERLLPDTDRELDGLRESASCPPLPADRWWWD